jgi:drug/metabolite transporter (DMT)-like permease
MTRMRADLLLLLVALIWGTAFIAQKYANEVMGPLRFVGLRFLLSWLALAPLAWRENRRAGQALTRDNLGLAGVIGLCLFLGASLQQIGLVQTSATNGGFLTALYVIFVPPIVWAITKKPPRAVVLLASLVSIVGAWLLAGKESFGQWTSGDALVLLADIAWAGAISLTPLFLRRADRPFFLAFAQYGVVALLGLTAGWLFEPAPEQGFTPALRALLYAGLLSGAVAYTAQIIAQKSTPPAEAALILSLESVFAALSGAFLLSERLTRPALFGAALILIGVLLVEAGPILQNILARGQRRADRLHSRHN